ncbi:MAG: FAD-dependent oxidoreductase [Rickettsiales bacterium]|jgi:thioredoxin reductase (NADPH)|nr:FAD-dependent oxidoreductase [Rickettsiales bacterium]
MYDVIILGSGPAGLTAALYTARAGKKTLVLGGDQLGGQLNVIHALENYPGFAGAGSELAALMKKQAESFGAEIVFANAKTIRHRKETEGNGYTVISDNGLEYDAAAIIIATGAKPRKLEIEGAREFMGRGVSYCATCDGFFYSRKDVLVIGGGNSALSDALYLSNIAKSVRILYRKGTFARAEQVQVDRIDATENITVMFNTELAKVGGDETGLAYAVTTSGENISASGVFVAIGHEANTDYLPETYPRDNMGRLVPDGLPKGIYVAGDVRSNIKMQVATAVGWGCEAAMDAIAYLNQK